MATAVTLSDLKDYYESDAVETQVDFSVLKSLGFPTDGNPLTGLPATLPGAAWFALVSAMRISVIKAAGLTPSSTPDPLQFLTALQSMSWMQDKKITYSMLVDALTATGDKAKGLTDNNCFLTPLSLQSVIDVICPPGMFGLFHATDVPEGWLLCNGAIVSRSTYSRLFTKIGTKYGAGDGSTTFALPNLDGRVLQGTTNTGLVGNYLEASLPNIKGTFEVSAVYGGDTERRNAFYSVSGAFVRGDSQYSKGSVSGDDTPLSSSLCSLNLSRGSSIYNGSSVQPKALSVLPCIKT